MSGKQKKALEKVTGKCWNSWNAEAVKAYFAYTDKGLRVPVSDEASPDLAELMSCHRFHPVTVEMWKEDFRAGLLFLNDFDGGPDAYIEHATEIYKGVMA